MFLLESPHRGDSNEYTQYTIFNMNKKKHPRLSQICSHGFFSKGLKNEFETAVVNEPSVFKSLKFYSSSPTRVKSAIKKNINSTSTSCIRLRYSCLNWHVTSLFELYQYFVAGHVPYKFQRNPILSIRNHNSWPNANPYLNAIIISICIHLLKFKEFHQTV